MVTPLIVSVLKVLMIVLNMVEILVIGSVLASWLGADQNNQIVVMIRSMTEPLFRPFRKLTRSWSSRIDWSPMIVLLLIVTLQVVMKEYVESLSMMGAAGPGVGARP